MEKTIQVSSFVGWILLAAGMSRIKIKIHDLE